MSSKPDLCVSSKQFGLNFKNLYVFKF